MEDIGRTLLAPIAAGLAVQAGIGEPFDTDAITNLHWGVRSVAADGNDNADSLMAANER